MARKTFKIGDVVTFSTTARPVRYQGRKAVVVETEKVGTRTRYALDFGSRKATPLAGVAPSNIRLAEF
jgi:hypothetical protein